MHAARRVGLDALRAGRVADGTLIAAAVGAPEPSDATSVIVFDARTGAAVRQLAANGSAPAFSPDGEQVAYAGADGWIHVVPTRGGPSRRLVEGVSPTWGDGDAPGPAVASTSLRFRKGRIAVKVRCTGTATCRGTLRIAKGKATLGRRAYRTRAGQSSTVSVTPTSRGRRTIARSRKLSVTVQLKSSTGDSVTEKVTLRR